jgi:hypothetical protein
VEITEEDNFIPVKARDSDVLSELALTSEFGQNAAGFEFLCSQLCRQCSLACYNYSLIRMLFSSWS